MKYTYILALATCFFPYFGLFSVEHSLIFAPKARISSTISLWLLSADFIKGVSPESSRALTLTPCFKKIWTVAKSPLAAALINPCSKGRLSI